MNEPESSTGLQHHYYCKQIMLIGPHGEGTMCPICIHGLENRLNPSHSDLAFLLPRNWFLVL